MNGYRGRNLWQRADPCLNISRKTRSVAFPEMMRNDDLDRLPNRFQCRVAEQLLGFMAPHPDMAGSVLHNFRFSHRCELWPGASSPRRQHGYSRLTSCLRRSTRQVLVGEITANVICDNGIGADDLSRSPGLVVSPTTARGGGTPCMGPWMSRVKTWREPLFFFLSARTEVGRASHRSGRRRSTSRVRRRRPDRWLASGTYTTRGGARFDWR